jgi:hypothetical protein
MANKVIGTQIKIEGDKQYKESLKEIARQASLLKSEMKLVTSEFSNNANSMDALKKKQDVLERQFDGQKDKVNTLREALEKSKTEYGENAKQTEDWQKKLNYAEADLNKLNDELQKNEKYLKEAEDSTDKTAKSIDEFGKDVKDAEGNVSVFGDVLKASLLSEVIVEGIKKLGNAFKEVFVEGIELASDLEESQNVVNVTFEESANNVQNWSRTLANSFGISELNGMKFVGTMGAILKSSGVAQDAVVDMSESLVELAGDMASFYNIEVEEAFNKLRSGISGESEPLKQLGINMNVANLEAYALSQGIEKAYNSMSLAEQTTLRYNYILEATSDAQGDFTRTSNSLANQQKILALQFENFKTQIGAAALPSVTRVVNRLNDEMEDLGGQFESATEKISEGLADAIIFLIDNIDAVVASVKALTIGFLTFKGVSIGSTIVSSFVSLGTAITGATVAQTGLNVAMAANPIGMIATAIGALVGGFTLLSSLTKNGTDELDEFVKKVDEVTAKTEEMLQEIEDAREERMGAVGEVEAAADGYRNMADAIFELSEKTNLNTGEQKLLSEMVAQLNDEIPNLNLLYNEQTGLLNMNKDAVYQLIEAREKELMTQAAGENLTEVYRQMAAAQDDLAKQENERLKLSEELQRRKEAERVAWEKYDKALQDATASGQDVIYATMEQNDEWQKAFTALENAEKALEEYDATTGDTISAVRELKAEEEYWRTYIATNGDVEAARQAMLNYKNSVDGAGTATDNLLIKTQNTTSQIAREYAGLPTKADLYSAMYNAGVNTVQGFEDGFNWRWKIFQPQLSTSANDVTTKYKQVLGIRSPSKEMEKLGEFTGEGYEIGLIDSMKRAEGELQKLMDSSKTILGGVSNSMNITQNLNTPDYSGMLSSISALLAGKQNMNANIVVNITGKQLQYAIKGLDVNQTMRYSEG